jgi:hypothetical protein
MELTNTIGDTMTVKRFCERNSISHSLFYELLKRGEGPKCIVIGRKRLISKESAETWRKRFEQAA